MVVEKNSHALNTHLHLTATTYWKKVDSATSSDIFDFNFIPAAKLGIRLRHYPHKLVAEVVEASGLAYAQGMMRDDEIIEVNGVSVASLSRFQQTYLIHSRPLDLTIRRRAIDQVD